MVGPVKPQFLDSSPRLLPLKAPPALAVGTRRRRRHSRVRRAARDQDCKEGHLRGTVVSAVSSCRRPGGWSRAKSLRRWIILIFACWLTHDSIRQGLPHSTYGRRRRNAGPRVGRGFPLPYIRQEPPPRSPGSRARSGVERLYYSLTQQQPGPGVPPLGRSPR